VDEGWDAGPSNWSVVGGELAETTHITDRTGTDPSDLPKLGTYLRYDGGGAWTDYTVSVRLRSDDDDAIGVMFRLLDGDNFYRFSMDAQRSYRRLVKNVGGTYTLLAEDGVAFNPGQSYDVEISAQGSTLEVRIDGALVFSVQDSDLSTGTVGLYNWANNGAYFDDLSIEGPAQGNLGPQIVSVGAAPQAISDASGASTTLTVQAIDPDGDDALLSYQWSVMSGGGSLDDPMSPSPEYTPADVGADVTVTLAVDVTDADGLSATALVDVTVLDSDGPQELFAEDFGTSDLSGWTAVDEGWDAGPSNWSVVGGELAETTHITDRTGTDPADLPKLGTYLRYDGGGAWTDTITSVRLRSEDDDAIGVVFRLLDGDNFYRFSMDSQRGYRRLVKNVGGTYTLLAEDGVAFNPGQSYDVEISAQGSTLEVRMDGALVFSVQDSDLSTGTVGLYNWANNGAYFDDLTVTGRL
jgi:hypothetical protein